MVLPPGSFTMGSPASEPGRNGDEGPQHNVTLMRPFAVGKFALTFDEWDACAAAGGCSGYKPDDGLGPRTAAGDLRVMGRRPGLCGVAAELTGKPYRLLTEAEYEYAARAGMQTAYPWGNAIGNNNANCEGCGSQWDNKQTAPVGSFAPNGSASMMWWATSGSGWRIAGMTVTTERRPTARPGPLAIAVVVFRAAGPGKPFPSISAPRPAAGAP